MDKLPLGGGGFVFSWGSCRDWVDVERGAGGGGGGYVERGDVVGDVKQGARSRLG